MEEEVEFESIMYPDEGIKTLVNIYLTSHSHDIRDLELSKIFYTKGKYKLNIKKEYIPQNGDKIYIDPSCNIPRFKLRAWGEPQNISIVRSPDKATVKVASDDIIRNNCEWKYGQVIRIDVFSKIPKFEQFKDLYKLIDESIASGIITDKDYIYGNYPFSNLIESTIDTDEDDLFEGVQLHFIKEGGEKTLKDVLNPAAVYYHENAILNLINNTHGTIMDEQMYTTIKSLFQSEDTNNHVVAMESMANCIYSESAIYLLKLIEEFRSEMYNNRVKNNVNFKSLLNFFNVNLSRRYDIDDILASLSYANLFTSENLSTLYPEIIERIQDGGNFEYFEVDTIKLTEKGLQALQLSEPVNLQNDPIIQ